MEPVAEITLLDFRKLIRADERRIPIDGTIETTYRCNLRCAHCYVNEAVGDEAERRRELPLARLKELVDEVVEAGCLFVLFTGGEVLVRPDFPELYLYAFRKGLIITVFTNGTLVTDRIAELFAEHRPEAIEISLYGMTRETYERVTGIPGSYDKCIAGIRRLVERRLPVRLKTMALTWNMDEVAEMEAYAHSLGLPFRFDSLLNPRVDCGANRKSELQLTAEQALALDLGNPARMEELRDFCTRFADPETPRDSEHVYVCGAGQTSFTVDPHGKLQMCQLSRKSSHDLRESSFDAGWNGLFKRLRERTWQSNGICRSCSLISLCGSCPGAAEMETGDLEGVVPQFCEIAHARAFAVMGEASGHRPDATCCLGRGGAAPVASGHGCGSCGSARPEPLIQLQRRPTAGAPPREAAPDRATCPSSG